MKPIGPMTYIAWINSILVFIFGMIGITLVIRESRLTGFQINKRFPMIFFILPCIGFSLVLIDQGFLFWGFDDTPYSSYILALDCFIVCINWISYPLRFLPITVLILRLTICYYGKLQLFPPKWLRKETKHLSKMNLYWLLRQLLLFMLPYLVGMGILLYYMLTMDPHMPNYNEESSLISNKIFIYNRTVTLFIDFISLGMIIMLFLKRKHLKKLDLDQTKTLFTYFLLLLIFQFTAIFTDMYPSFFNFPFKLSYFIGQNLLAWVAFLIWYSNYRVAKKRHSQRIKLSVSSAKVVPNINQALDKKNILPEKNNHSTNID